MISFEEDLSACLKVLRAGGLILYPTDTIWGIGCDATNEQAVKRIYQLKQREESKSMIVLLADDRSILQYIAAPDVEVFDYLENLTKPTTIVFDGALGLAENLINADGSIGIRVVKEDFCRHLVKRLGKPLVSTSANISGKPSPQLFANIEESIKQGVDYVVHYRRDETKVASPSTIVRWEEGGRYTVIRP